MSNTMGMVFAMSNSSDSNQVIAFSRNMDGTLTRMKEYKTGGSGTGTQKVDPLSSQGSLIVSRYGNMLFAVNAGSNSISSFNISSNGELTLVGAVPSGGTMPNCLAMYGNILYVANSGNADNQTTSNLTGFQINRDGSISRIPGATYLMSSPNARPSCIVFNPSGNKLVVSELSTNKLSVFPVKSDGSLMQATTNDSNGAGPFGSVFLSNGILLVTEAGANALSSYVNTDSGKLTVISGSVANGQSATCWVSVNKNEQFAYTSNAGSNTITIYDVNQNGSLDIRKNVPNNPNKTAAPIDSGVSKDGQNLYVLNGNEGTISIFSIRQNGEINLIQVFEDTGLPQLGAQGLAVL